MWNCSKISIENKESEKFLEMQASCRLEYQSPQLQCWIVARQRYIIFISSMRHIKMNDAEKLEMTKRRINNLRLGNISLLKLSMTQAVKNICSYDVGDLEKLVKSTEMLNAPLFLEKIFEAFMNLKSTERQMPSANDFEKRLRVLSYLLSVRSNVETIEIGNGLLSFCPDSSKASNCLKVAQMISNSSLTETISTLIIDVDLSHIRPILIIEEMVESICKLGKLKKLEIYSFELAYSHVKRICNSLPELKILFIKFLHDKFPDLNDIEDVKSTFSRLEHLGFPCSMSIIIPSAERYRQLKDFCIRHLPNLEFISTALYPRLSSCKEEHLPLAPSSLLGLQINYPGLPHLHTLFPSLWFLKINWVNTNEVDKNSLPRFTKIQQLFLRNVHSRKSLLDLLDVYGRNMTELHVLPRPGIVITLDIFTILNFCPKLERLCLWETTIEDPIPISNFANLREIHILFYNNRPPSKVDFLSTILAAPGLVHVNLFLPHDCLDAIDLNLLGLYISRKKILQNLVHLQFGIRFTSPEFEYDAKIMEAFGNFIKSASALLPKLTNLQVIYLFNDNVSRRYLGNFVRRYGRQAAIRDLGAVVTDWLNDPNLKLFLEAYNPRCRNKKSGDAINPTVYVFTGGNIFDTGFSDF
ncbi:Hypothetical predicted protein [Cloeon dipterum]|uniref:Uncharacterized protein n=1 Tax=Cloeon dipterum TaxID=197152 RepID=A0A8S1D4C3_9INSE|nr:Hypothetical predicted protein [Cloeon dipterum]